MAEKKLKSIIGPPGPKGDAGVQGPPGPPGSASATYQHDQTTASNTWIINHNLGYRPDVTLYTLGWFEFIGDITHTSINQTIISLAFPLAGYARLN